MAAMPHPGYSAIAARNPGSPEGSGRPGDRSLSVTKTVMPPFDQPCTPIRSLITPLDLRRYLECTVSIEWPDGFFADLRRPLGMTALGEARWSTKCASRRVTTVSVKFRPSVWNIHINQAAAQAKPATPIQRAPAGIGSEAHSNNAGFRNQTVVDQPSANPATESLRPN